MRKNKVLIPETPEAKVANIQSDKERNSRLQKWSRLLRGVLKTSLEVDKGDFRYAADQIRDNKDRPEFVNSIFILLTDLASQSEYGFVIFYFCFSNDGTFHVHVEDSISDYPEILNYPEVKIGLEIWHKFDDKKTMAWEEGYHFVVDFVEKVFWHRIPKTPRKKS
jgi:hypothetical protein